MTLSPSLKFGICLFFRLGPKCICFQMVLLGLSTLFSSSFECCLCEMENGGVKGGGGGCKTLLGSPTHILLDHFCFWSLCVHFKSAPCVNLCCIQRRDLFGKGKKKKGDEDRKCLWGAGYYFILETHCPCSIYCKIDTVFSNSPSNMTPDKQQWWPRFIVVISVLTAVLYKTGHNQAEMFQKNKTKKTHSSTSL